MQSTAWRPHDLFDLDPLPAMKVGKGLAGRAAAPVG